MNQYLRTVLSTPSATCSYDLEGLGEKYSETQTAIYLVIDEERKAGWFGRGTTPSRFDDDDMVRLVHAISRHAKGEVRGYFLRGDELHVRLPASPAEWPELDALVSEALGAMVVL